MKAQSSVYGLPKLASSVSEDAFRVHVTEREGVAALADGTGSAKQGALAARRAVDMFMDYYQAKPRAWTARRAMAQFLDQINRILFQESELRFGSPEFVCTFTVVVLEAGRLCGFNVGDSPAYLCRSGRVSRLSTPHTLGEPGMEHVLTRALGLESSVQADWFEVDLEAGDQLLLCSDGVSQFLKEEALLRLFSKRALARSFVAEAKEQQEFSDLGPDDASAIQLEVLEPGSPQDSVTRELPVPGGLREQQVLDGYQLKRALQADARVWLAQAPLGDSCVLKFPPLQARTDELLREAFLRECWQAVRLKSPGLVQARLPLEATHLYYELDYVEAPSLRQELEKAALGAAETVELGRFLLGCLQSLLSQDLVHGDVKPDNILVQRHDEGLRFRLLDFGSVAQIFSVVTQAGTASYLAPERFKGAAISEQTELFAVGVTLYESLTGRYPYGEIERFQQPNFEGSPKLPSRLNPLVPPWLDAVLLRSLAIAPKDRYGSYSEMLYDLEHPESVEPYLRKGASLIERNPLKFFRILCALLAALNVFLLWLLFHR